MRLTMFFLGLLISAPAISASCWKISDLRGEAYYHAHERKFQPDGFSRPLYLLIDGDKTMMADVEGMTYIQVGPYSVFGVNSDGTHSTHESWLIDPSLGVVFYTKAVVGSQSFAPTNLDGVRAFVGKAVRCPSK